VVDSALSGIVLLPIGGRRVDRFNDGRDDVILLESTFSA